MFVNNIPFLLTVSRNLRFVTVPNISNRQVPTVAKELQHVVRLYKLCGFRITSMLCEPEFEELCATFPFLNPCSADEHVPEVERMVRTIKDRVCSVYVTLPFCHIPRLMVKRLDANAFLWWSALPAPDSVSTVHSPCYLLVGNETTYDKHVRLKFGSYVQTQEAHTNKMSQCTLGAICLGPTGNSQGGHSFMSLTSGDCIIRHKWTSLPMPDEAIARVSQIGHRQDDHADVSGKDSDYSYDSLSDLDASLVLETDSSTVSNPDLPAMHTPTFPAATGVTELDQLNQALNNSTALEDDHIKNPKLDSLEETDDQESTGVEEEDEANDHGSTGVNDDDTHDDESTGVTDEDHSENA
ncbi:hypothetical protein IV203_008463 [Nitzschia inconspicua]|uniref:Uncharacterized protein n=1 Tax=Nitzschia inconspicua TaxID=303405 RepID=A0A9K3KYJ1_9STRA|nr:hypothetical protein IV203_008463 [Nitzschia inconspicua]